MDDRLVRSGLAGILAGLWIEVSNNVSYFVLHFAKARWATMLTQLVLGHDIKVPMDEVLSHILFFTWVAGLGAIFGHFIVPKPLQHRYLLRGPFYGLAVWFVTYTIGTLYKVPHLYHIAWQTAMTNIISVTIWGLILGWLMRRWDRVYERTAVHR